MDENAEAPKPPISNLEVKPESLLPQESRIQDVIEAQAIARAGNEFRTRAAHLKLRGEAEDQLWERELKFQNESGYHRLNEEERNAKMAPVYEEFGHKLIEIDQMYSSDPEYKAKTISPDEARGRGKSEIRYGESDREYVHEQREEKIKTELKEADRLEHLVQALHRHPEVTDLDGNPLTLEKSLYYIEHKWDVHKWKVRINEAIDRALAKGKGVLSHNIREILQIPHSWNIWTPVADAVGFVSPEGHGGENIDELLKGYDDLVDRDETTIGELRAYTADNLRKYAELAQKQIDEIDNLLKPINEEIDKELANNSSS